MSDPTTASGTGWSSPEVVAALISLFVSSIVSIIVAIISWAIENIRFAQRRTNDRKYNAEVHLYQNIVVLNASNSFACVDNLDTVFENMLGAIQVKKLLVSKRRDLVEKAVEEFDRLNDVFSKEIISKSRLFSPEYAKLLESIWTVYYDECTDLASSLTIGDLKAKVAHVGPLKSAAKENFVTDLSKLTRDVHPKAD